MFFPSRMTRVLLGGHTDHMAKAIEVVHNHGGVHLEDYDDADGVTRMGTPLEAGDVASARLVKTRGLLKALGAEDTQPKDIAVADIDRLLDEAQEAIVPVEDRLAAARTRIAALDHESTALTPFTGMDVELSLVDGLTSLRSFLGIAREDPRAAFQAEGVEGEWEVRPTGAGFALVAFVTPGTAAQADRVLATCGFQATAVAADITGTPSDRLRVVAGNRDAATQELSKAEQELANLRESWASRLASLEASLTAEVARTQAPLRFGVTANTFHVEGWVPSRSLAALRTALDGQFGDRIYLEQLGDGPSVVGHGDGHGEGHDDHHDDPADEPPVHLDHKGMASPFIFLLQLLARPRYKEIDPTVLMLWFFPLFFGLMVGDVAVGLAIALLGLYLKKNNIFGIGGPAVGRALVMGGVMAAIVGGVVFGEALGVHFVVSDEAAAEGELSWEILTGYQFPTEGFIHKEVSHHGGHAADTSHAAGDPGGSDAAPTDSGGGITTHAAETEDASGGFTSLMSLTPHGTTHLSVNGWFNLGYYSKVHDVSALLAWSLIIGLVHLVFGLILGVRNVYVTHGATLAIQEKVAWLTLMGGFGFLLLGPEGLALPVGGGVIAASLVLLWMGAAKVLGAGFVALLEVFGLVGNLLSYTRLAAIGASKAGMAIAFANIGFTLAGGQTIGEAPGLVWWIVYLLGMVVITLLATLSGGLQSLRLQFVEFFQKFFIGGGRAYQPFGGRNA